MAENTAIEWADHTFNPWWGCTKVSAACDHCYAETWSDRWAPGQWGPHAPRRRTSPANWRKPLQWNARAEREGRRHRVFCASMADVFDNHRSITSGWHGDLWHLIAATPHLDWLLLTKRPQNIAKMLPETYGAPAWGDGWPNVWLGTTIENQTQAERRAHFLFSVPARIRFFSCEPLLGPLNLRAVKFCDEDGYEYGEGSDDVSAGRIDWVIAGGESGKHARPTREDWFLDLRDQCTAAGVPFFFKQWGEWGPDTGPLPDGRDPVMEGKTKAAYFDGTDWQIHRDAYAIDIEASKGCGEWAHRLGKKRTGRILDGQTWDQVPETSG